MWHFPHEFLQSFKNSFELLAGSVKKFKEIEKVKELRQVFGMKFEKNENAMSCKSREERYLLGLGAV